MTVGRCRCGAEATREIPDDLREPWRGMLERTPQVCNDCAARAAVLEHDRSELRERERQAQLLRNRQRASGIPSQLQGLTWEDVTAGNRPEVLRAARRLAAGDLSGLLLSGPVGVGKTWLAAAAAWTLLERGPVRWFSVPALFARLGLSFADTAREEALSVLAGTKALVLDDLDKVRASEYAAEQLFCAIDNRITAGAHLLVTTNLGLGELAARFPQPYGEAIVSRLVGYCEAFALEGADRRLERFAS